MSNDFSPINNPESESPMFAGVPSWERGKKSRSFGGRGNRAAAEPRSFAPEYAPEPGDPIPTRPVNLSEDARAYEGRMDTVDPTDTAFASGATFADRTKRKGGATAPIMVAAGIILVGGLAAGGWYAMQPHNTGVAELTPGTGAATTTATTTATTPGDTTTAATSAPTQVAQNATPPAPAAAAAHATTVTTTTHASKAVAVHTAVTRAPPARSASEAGANASTTAAPARISVPAPAAPPTAAAPPAPLVLALPPQAAPTTPAPAPAETPLPTQTAPAAPPTQTPPN